MTKLAQLVISGTLLSGSLVSVVASAADKAPAPAAAAPAAAPAAKAPAAATAPVATKEMAPAGAKAAAPAAAAPAAAPAAPMEAPKPSPEIDTLYKPWEGSWKCETTFNAGAMGPGSPEVKTTSAVKIKKELGGFWYRGEYKVKKVKGMPGMEGVFVLGYDAGSKSAVSLNYDGMGGYSTELAPGATAAKLVLTGEAHMMGMNMKSRETMTKTSDKAMEHEFEMDMGKGFQPMGVDVCKK